MSECHLIFELIFSSAMWGVSKHGDVCQSAPLWGYDNVSSG